MSKKAVTFVVAGAVVLAVAGFVGGMLLGPKLPFARTALGGATFVGGPGGVGGPMANLTDEERAKIENMTQEERRAYFQEKMGGAAPDGVRGRGMRGGSIEGKVLEVAADSFTVQTTDGGSQTVYTSADTVLAYAKGVSAAELKVGDNVIALTEPEADGVVTATALIVK